MSVTGSDFALERVRVRLAEGRRAGLEFEEVWPAAIAGSGKGTYAALTDTRSAWRAAYYREPAQTSKLADLACML